MPLFYAEAMGLRPVVAYEVSNGMYRITGTEEGLKPEDLGEEWLFPVDSYVICRTSVDEQGNLKLIADIPVIPYI